jgi:hypothetical protein
MANSAQRISQEFYNSHPVYSEPPPVLMSDPPQEVRDPMRVRKAHVLFGVLFVPMLVLLVVALLR